MIVLCNGFGVNAQPSPNNLAALLEQAKSSYQAGDLDESQRLWQTLAEGFAADQDLLNQAMALGNLSLVSQKLGDWQTAKTAIAESQKLLNQTEGNPGQPGVLAQSLDIQAQWELSQDNAKQAIETWQGAAKIYQSLNDRQNYINSQINQSLAYQALGLSSRACQTLLSLLEPSSLDCRPQGISTALTELQLDFPPDTSPKNQRRTLHVLSDVLRNLGQFQAAYLVAFQQWQLANDIQSPPDLAQAELTLSNAALAIADQKLIEEDAVGRIIAVEIDPTLDCSTKPLVGSAVQYYQQAASCYQLAASRAIEDKTIQLQAQLNLLALELHLRSPVQTPGLFPDIQRSLKTLPVNRTTTIARLQLSQNILCWQHIINEAGAGQPRLSPLLQTCANPLIKTSQGPVMRELANQPWFNDDTAIQLAQAALSNAKILGDIPLQANALGYLGAIAYQKGDLASAQKFTEQASQTISNFSHPEIAYLWQWQLGRILQQQGKINQALPVYQSTYNLLQSLRQALVGANAELQFTFRDQVEPIYREYVDLLLQSNLPEQEKLSQSRDVIEALQIAELNNFFQEVCLEGDNAPLETMDEQAAIIYAIKLPQRLALILSLPHQPLKLFQTAFDEKDIQGNSSKTIEKEIRTLLANILTSDFGTINLRSHQRLYDRLIRPLEASLNQHKIETLVFVLDGTLQSIPISTLHDGHQYLIEKYNVAIVPSLRLLPKNSIGLMPKVPDVLIAGLSDARPPFNALPGVEQEIEDISVIYPAEILLNTTFTPDNLEASLGKKDFSIVHLATHGQFSSKAENTFLLTWDTTINVKELDQLLRETRERVKPVELLILSACQTATGDNRAPLGMAGVAVRSGANSTLATLWKVDDQSTSQLIAKFYEALNHPGTTKAQALRQAQLELLHNEKYQHPYFWSPFVLVGSWL